MARSKLPFDDEQAIVDDLNSSPETVEEDAPEVADENELELSSDEVKPQAALKYFMNDQSGQLPETSASTDMVGKSVGISQSPPPKLQQYESLLSEMSKLKAPRNELKEIQQDVADKNTNLSLGMAGNQIAQAIASGYGGKIGDGSDALNMLSKQNQQKVTDYKDLQKNRMDDPQSDISRTYRLIIAKAMSQKYPDLDLNELDNMSAHELEQLAKSQLKTNASANRIFDKNIVDPKTKQIRSQLFDSSGNLVKDLGEAGYSYGSTVDPYTGQTKLISKSNPGADPILQGNPNAIKKEEGQPETPKAKQTPFEVKQMLNPKEKDILDKDVNQFQTEIKDEKRIISEIGAISDSSLQLATKNPNSANTLGAQIAKIMQGSRLTDADVQLYTGQAGILNKLQDFTSELLTGTITNEKAKNIKEVLQTYNTALRSSLENRANQAAEITKQNFSPSLNIDNNALSKLYYIDDKKIGNSQSGDKAPAKGEVRRKTSDGKIAIFDEATKKFLRYEN